MKRFHHLRRATLDRRRHNPLAKPCQCGKVLYDYATATREARELEKKYRAQFMIIRCRYAWRGQFHVVPYKPPTPKGLWDQRWGGGGWFRRR